MTTQFVVHELNRPFKYYYTLTSEPISSTKILYDAIEYAAANGCSIEHAFDESQHLTPYPELCDIESLPPADKYVYYDLHNCLMGENNSPQPPPMEVMPDAAVLDIHRIKLMQSYKYSLASLIKTERRSHEWLGHADVQMDVLPLNRLSYHLLDETVQAEWRDVLNAKVVAVQYHPTQPGHRIYRVTGINPGRLMGFHAAVAGEVAKELQWEHEVESIVAACKAAAEFNIGIYPESAYPWAIEKCDEPEGITTRIYTDEYSIRNGFVYKDIALVQQVEGGDEWLALKNRPEGWVAFESYSLAHMMDKHGEAYAIDLIEQLAGTDLEHLMDRPGPELEPDTGHRQDEPTM